MVCTISVLFSFDLGVTLYPKFSITFAVNTAVFKLFATTLGAMNNPCNIFLFIPNDGPTSFPSPGNVSLSETSSIKSCFPTTYAPFGAIPPPKFLINDPTNISAPNSLGSILFVSSP